MTVLVVMATGGTIVWQGPTPSWQKNRLAFSDRAATVTAILRVTVSLVDKAGSVLYVWWAFMRAALGQSHT